MMNTKAIISISNNPPPFGLRECLYNHLLFLNPSFLSYYASVIILLLVLLIFTFFPSTSRVTRSTTIYFLSIFLTILAFKWPDLFKAELNPDESYCIAVAMKLLEDPVYWRSAVGATHGPLLHYPLLIPYLFGLVPDYAFARLLAIILFSLSFLITSRAVEIFFGKSIGRIALFPFIAIFALSSSWDFAGYNGEHVTIFLLSICFYYTAKLANVDRAKIGRTAFFLGIFLGVVPFSKLQGMPQAIATFIIGLCIIYAREFHERKTLKTFCNFFSGLILFPAIIFISVWLLGGFREFWISYILHNFSYASRIEMSFLSKANYYFKKLYSSHIEIPELINGQLLAFLASLLLLTLDRKKVTAQNLSLLAASLFILAAGFTSVVQPGNFFSHYSLFLIIPLTILFSVHFGLVAELAENSMKRFLLTFALLTFTFLIPFSRILILSQRPFIAPSEVPRTLTGGNSARILRALTNAREPLVIWGWYERLYQEANLVSGTRYPSIYLHQQKNPYQDYFIEQFVSDFKASSAPVFIDAIGKDRFGASDRSVDGHETIPELHKEISVNYFLLVDIEHMRIYVRKDRWKEIKVFINKRPEILDYTRGALKVIYSAAGPEFDIKLSERRIRNHFFDHALFVLNNMRALGKIPNTEHDTIIALALANFNDKL